MRVVPISEKEAEEAGLWKRGIYDFEVLAAEEKVSSKGSEMLKLNLKLYNAEGHSTRLFDYIINSEQWAFKLRHFASSTGLLPQYEKGELSADSCVGRTGRCQLGIEKAKGGFPAKNKIDDYVPLVPGAPPVAAPAPADEIDDEIPF